jgi:hypothetical protein
VVGVARALGSRQSEILLGLEPYRA